jgi:PhnB protein
MPAAFKPSGYNSVSPYFIVNGAQKMIDLLKKIFNVQELRRYDLPDGTIMHVEVKLDDSVVMIADSNEQYPPNQILVHIYVSDAKATYEKALAAGCEGIESPTRHDGDPDMRGMFKDFQGNMWAVGTQMP